MKNNTIEPRDTTSIVRAYSQTYPGGMKCPIDVWDDGFGPLWIMRDSISIVGIVRAQTWEDAYSCCVDELMHDGELPPEEFEDDHEETCWNEANEWRGSGVPSNPRFKLPVAAKDLNGESLDLLTPAFMKELGIRVILERWEA